MMVGVVLLAAPAEARPGDVYVPWCGPGYKSLPDPLTCSAWGPVCWVVNHVYVCADGYVICTLDVVTNYCVKVDPPWS